MVPPKFFQKNNFRKIFKNFSVKFLVETKARFAVFNTLCKISCRPMSCANPFSAEVKKFFENAKIFDFFEIQKIFQKVSRSYFQKTLARSIALALSYPLVPLASNYFKNFDLCGLFSPATFEIFQKILIFRVSSARNTKLMCNFYSSVI